MTQPQKPRDRGDFQIAIICALPLEADAVEALFDKFWGEDGELYGKAPGDPNAYTTGIIGLHNIVLAQLPGTGKSSAANFASGIRSSFQGIKLAIIVGICGGMPFGNNDEEILLGDVIISDALVEYDFGRQWPDNFARKDTLHDSLGRPNAEIRALLAKLARLKSLKRLADNTFHYLTKLEQELGVGKAQYPGVHADKLFATTYRHKHYEFPGCTICAKCKKRDDNVCETALKSSCSELKCNENCLVARNRLLQAVETRSTPKPMVHFGTIASGDTIMKSGEHRDAIATKENVIAFEMEGAGVWDIFPCIVIKGVCDYADSHKNKGWQNYAAAAAASCMKAFLKEWLSTDKETQPIRPPLEVTPNRPIEVALESTTLEKSISDCLLSLSFSNIDDRQNSIHLAHPETCDWLFKTAQFEQWRDRTDLPSHNGVLWIKGNPGAGKSTLMKHTMRYCQETFKDYVIAAYFFNARGNLLEKTPLGMLRSLLYQLLDQDPLFCKRFIPVFLNKQKKLGKDWEWHVGELKDFLFTELKRPQRKPLVLLIDALDECSELDVRAVVSFLESLSVIAVSSNIILNICLSSRHYPHVSIEKGLELTVEKEGGHDQDIAKYVNHKLRVRNKEIEQELLQKAAHIFMWVVLVVEILNTAFDSGEVRAMQKKIREIPSDLDEVFFALLNKDNPNKRDTILMLQWVLFATRLLKPEELYFAVLVGAGTEELGAWNRSNDTLETIKRFITSTSKGLVEVRKGNEEAGETVQFIHESVNDFLLRNGRLQTLDPMLELYTIGASHDRLAACCISYIMMHEIEPLVNDMSDTKSVDFEMFLAFNYPFLEYAVTSVLYHTDKAQAGGVMQQARVLQLQQSHEEFKRLRIFHDIFAWNNDQILIGNADLVYVVSLFGYYELVRVILFDKGANVNAQGGTYGNALQAASSGGYKEIVALQLEKGANVNAQGGTYGNALQAASHIGHKEIVALLLKKKANVNAQGGRHENALQAASFRGYEEIVALLLEKGADVNAQGGRYGNALQVASCGGYKEIVALLLEKGADVNAQGGRYGNALQAASSGGYKEIVALLLDKGANVNAQDGIYGNALQAASSGGYKEIVALLLEKGANVNARGGMYENALQAALNGRHEETVYQLLEAGAVSSPRKDTAGQNRPVATRTRLKRKRELSGVDSQ